MKNSAFYLHVILLGLFISSCDDYALDLGFTSPSNKVKAPTPGYISLVFGEGVVTQRTSWYLTENTNTYLTRFDKRDYPDARAIIFAPELRSASGENYCYADLFNVTDSVSILNSEVQTNATTWSVVKSSDILQNLPDKRIDLAIRLRSEGVGFTVASSSRSHLQIFLPE